MTEAVGGGGRHGVSLRCETTRLRLGQEIENLWTTNVGVVGALNLTGTILPTTFAATTATTASLVVLEPINHAGFCGK